MNMVEKVAAAIVRNDRNFFTWHFPGDAPRQWESPGGAYLRTTELSPATAENVRKQARAAIEAMREPTPEMLRAARLEHLRATNIWQAMIGAALEDGKE